MSQGRRPDKLSHGLAGHCRIENSSTKCTRSEVPPKKYARVQWFVRFCEIPIPKRHLLGRRPSAQEIFWYDCSDCDNDIHVETIIGPVQVVALAPEDEIPVNQKSEETLFVKLSWNKKNFAPLPPEELAALRRLECQKPLEAKTKSVKSPSWSTAEQEVKRIESSHSTSRSYQDPAHTVTPNAMKSLECGGFTRKPNMRLSRKILCDSLDSQKTCKRRAAFSETTSPPKKPQPGEIKTSSALETLGKNGHTQPFFAKSSMVLRTRGTAVKTTKLTVESALSPVRSRSRYSVAPSVGLTPQYIGRKAKEQETHKEPIHTSIRARRRSSLLTLKRIKQQLCLDLDHLFMLLLRSETETWLSKSQLVCLKRPGSGCMFLPCLTLFPVESRSSKTSTALWKVNFLMEPEGVCTFLGSLGQGRQPLCMKSYAVCSRQHKQMMFLPLNTLRLMG
ncbi:origin recognition complex, subunit 1-like (S.cereviaiae), isoform CRA_c [Rattus norvegicus]|uniref:Origin recognition complex, subunit 1-like (S.cereviaiae), isoform CRA_c n=1 Tax=Rattus norvegicus TaxID=10116 RepID=A6JYV6_RAT|nr:origin recognition complex, subunit 1-like (S.cereviaiae), isoform CRA_c [Rattus norvegicus]